MTKERVLCVEKGGEGILAGEERPYTSVTQPVSDLRCIENTPVMCDCVYNTMYVCFDHFENCQRGDANNFTICPAALQTR